MPTPHLQKKIISSFIIRALAARNDSTFSFHPFPLVLGVTDVVREEERFDRLDGDEITSVADNLIGFPIYLRTGVTPTLKFGSFTLTPILNMQFNAVIRDRVHPVLDINYRFDKGIILGGGMYFGNKKKGHSIAFGIAGKYLKRQSIFGQFDLFGSVIADAISSDDSEASQLEEDLGKSTGTGLGLDLGVDWRYKTKKSTLALGLSVLDAFDTKIKTISGPKDVPDQQMHIKLGSSFEQKAW